MQFIFFLIFFSIYLQVKTLDEKLFLFLKLSNFPIFQKFESLTFSFILQKEIEILKIFCFCSKLKSYPSHPGILVQVNAAESFWPNMQLNLTSKIIFLLVATKNNVQILVVYLILLSFHTKISNLSIVCPQECM